jgi:hypothetical protein
MKRILFFLMLILLLASCKEDYEVLYIKKHPTAIIGDGFHYAMSYDSLHKMIGFCELGLSQTDTLYKVEFEYNSQGEVKLWNYLVNDMVMKTGIYTYYSDSTVLELFVDGEIQDNKFIYHYTNSKLSNFVVKTFNNQNNQWQNSFFLEYFWINDNLSKVKTYFSYGALASSISFHNFNWLWLDHIGIETFGGTELILGVEYEFTVDDTFNPFINTPLYLMVFPSHYYQFIGKNLIMHQKISWPSYEATMEFFYTYFTNTFNYPESVSEESQFYDPGHEVVIHNKSYDINY